MNRIEIVRLYDSNVVSADDEADAQNVFWVSRHKLLPTQEEVLYYIHDRDVKVYSYYDMTFSSGIDAARSIARLSGRGCVYGVFPRSFFDFINSGVGVPDLQFRTFYGTVGHDDYAFSCVEEVVVSAGVQRRSIVFNSNNLAYLKSRCVS